MSGRDMTFGGYQTRRDAVAKLRVVEAEIAAGTLGKHNELKFGDYVAGWLDSKSLSLKYSSYKDYRQVFENHVLPSFSNRLLCEISPMDIQQWIDALSRSGMSSSTVNKCYRYVRSCMKQAESWEVISRSPCRSIVLPRVDRPELEFLKPAEIPLLLEKSLEPERTLYGLLAMSGLRLGEGISLAWRHIHFEDSVISVERSWSYASRIFQEPKTRKSRRAVPLMPLLADMLYPQRGEPHSLLFTRDGKTPIDMGTVDRRFKKALREANLRSVTVHSLRHTYASSLLACGASVKALQVALGHASASMTLDTYSHLIQEDLGSSVALAAEMFSGGKGHFLTLPGGTWGAQPVACTS